MFSFYTVPERMVREARAKRARPNHEPRRAAVCVREVSHRCITVCWSLISGLAVTVNVFATEAASARDMLRARFASASHVTRSGGKLFHDEPRRS